MPAGFAVVPEPDPAAGAFWPAVAALRGAQLAACADYVGIDMYPDVFGGRIEQPDLDRAAGEMLRTLRRRALPLAGIPDSTPVRVCENGWPTGPGRREHRQAEVLDTVLRAAHARRRELNITHWALFALRDADGAAWTSLTERGESRPRQSRRAGHPVRLNGGHSRPMVVTAGPDDAIWFSRGDGHIGRAGPGGAVTSVPALTPTWSSYGMCAGPDRTLWYTLLTPDRVGRISLDGGTEEFALPAGSVPSLITADPDGARWCTLNQADAIARITPPGDITTYPLPTAGAAPVGIHAGRRQYGSPSSAAGSSHASSRTGRSKSPRFPTGPAGRMPSPPPRTEAAGPPCEPPARPSGTTATAT